MNANTAPLATRNALNPERNFAKHRARRDALIARCLTSPKATEHDLLTARALCNPILGRISRS